MPRLRAPIAGHLPYDGFLRCKAAPTRPEPIREAFGPRSCSACRARAPGADPDLCRQNLVGDRTRPRARSRSSPGIAAKDASPSRTGRPMEAALAPASGEGRAGRTAAGCVPAKAYSAPMPRPARVEARAYRRPGAAARAASSTSSRRGQEKGGPLPSPPRRRSGPASRACAGGMARRAPWRGGRRLDPPPWSRRLKDCLKPRGGRPPRGFQDPGQEDRGVLSGKAAFAPDAPRPKGRAERFVGVSKRTLRDPCDTPGMAVLDPFLLLKARLRPQGVGRAFVTGTDLPA